MAQKFKIVISTQLHQPGKIKTSEAYQLSKLTFLMISKTVVEKSNSGLCLDTAE